jgi:translation initiation factor eIF-2B subunit beta
MSSADVKEPLARVIRGAMTTFELEERRSEQYKSSQIAVATLRLLRRIISSAGTGSEVQSFIQSTCSELRRHFPRDVIIGNVCDTVESRLEEEVHNTAPSDDDSDQPIHRSDSRSFLDMWNLRRHSEVEYVRDPLRDRMQQVIDELLGSIEATYENIAKHSSRFLVAREVVMTLGRSQAVAAFLTQHRTDATIVVPERAPEYDGWSVAAALQRHGLRVMVIPDSAIFAILPKITKIIVAAHAVLANGGIVGYSLSHSIALAAKHHSTPFIALYSHIKLSKTMPGPGKVFTALYHPGNVALDKQPTEENLVTMNPDGDYVPPELITLMINEDGPHCPGDVFSMVQVNYYNEP